MKRRAFTLRTRRAERRERAQGRVIARATRLISVTVLAGLAGAAPAAAQNLALEPVVDGLTAPLHLEEPADGSGRKFIVQQNGVVQVLGPDGRLLPEPFLDLRSRMLPLEENFEERGL